MHDTALINAKRFFQTYVSDLQNGVIVEIRSYDVNGSIKQTAPVANNKYIGLDTHSGPGVDVVLTDAYSFPFPNDYADVVVCSSCLEHSDMFWVSFLEMLRILKPSGIIYINVPSNGPYHPYPIDSWRFYKDSGKSLEKWAHKNGYNALLIQNYIHPKISDVWEDCVMIFLKDKSFIDKYPKRISGVGDDNTLLELCKTHHYDTDKYYDVKKSHSYIENVYNELFAEHKHTALQVLEIGIQTGGSHLLWRDYFPNAMITGIDKYYCPELSGQDRINQMQADAYNEEFIDTLRDDFYDIIIDDGGHLIEQQMTFLKKYLPKLKKKNGILVIEDVRDYSWMSGRSTHERIKIFQSLIPEHLSDSTFVEDLIEKDNRWDSLLIYIKT